LAQAKAMEVSARSMVAEAARMKKEAERMDPTVSARTTAPVPVTESAEAPKKRTRGPNKPKTAVADAAQ
jgi:ribosome assembly protein YihI (activator of Der GTPase)